jgi:dephospho-CoA kinase
MAKATRRVTLLTGPAASGKNTVANLYATRYCDRCAVIDGDVVRAMLHQPHAAPWEGEEGLRQHRLGVRHVCTLARSFVREGYEVVLLDPIWSDLPQIYRKELEGYGYAFKIVRLMPTWEASLQRLHERPPSISDEEARWVYQTQVALQDFDYNIDNSAQSVEETAAALSLLIRK